MFHNFDQYNQRDSYKSKCRDRMDCRFHHFDMDLVDKLYLNVSKMKSITRKGSISFNEKKYSRNSQRWPSNSGGQVHWNTPLGRGSHVPPLVQGFGTQTRPKKNSSSFNLTDSIDLTHVHIDFRNNPDYIHKNIHHYLGHIDRSDRMDYWRMDLLVGMKSC